MLFSQQHYFGKFKETGSPYIIVAFAPLRDVHLFLFVILDFVITSSSRHSCRVSSPLLSHYRYSVYIIAV